MYTGSSYRLAIGISDLGFRVSDFFCKAKAMCGIVGYIGKKSAVSILINGLKKLEYRGYDSAGLALVQNGKLTVTKKKGKVSEL